MEEMIYIKIQLPNNSQQFRDCTYPLKVRMTMTGYTLRDITFNRVY